ncbi:MAG: hypothetical protein U1F76_15185 [Candidatus Competibacteraceae bacterium]
MDKELIAQAAQHLKLRSIVLFECSLQRFGELGEQRTLGQQNKLSVRCTVGEASEEDRHFHLFRVLVELGVRAVELIEQDGQEAPPLFQIEATFQIDYELTSEVEQIALQEFGRYNAVHNAWPFWRQFVFSTANQAGLPCPEIPLRTDLQQ